MVTLEGRRSAEFGDLGYSDALEVHGGCAGKVSNMRRNRVVDLAECLAGDPHLLDLLRGFDHDGHN